MKGKKILNSQLFLGARITLRPIELLIIKDSLKKFSEDATNHDSDRAKAVAMLYDLERILHE